MAARTKIEWADETWSPIIGCDRVSPGCRNCYAITTARIREGNPHPRVAAAFAGTTERTEDGIDWSGKVNLLEDRLIQPLKWKKPRRIFVNSLSDLFHPAVPDEFIARVFAVMAQASQHTFQILTKRHARMRSFLKDICRCGVGHPPGEHVRAEMCWAGTPHSPTYVPGVNGHTVYHERPWPLPNVWIGVSVESQKWADIRIPALLDTPAAVRFLSCEPLLGPLDLTALMPPVSPVPIDEAPHTWAEWTWPDWVPAAVRDSIEGFWGADQGRTPADWLRDMRQQGAPAFGSVVRLRDGLYNDAPRTSGRFVHAWNNIGRLVRADGSFAYTSFQHGLERRRQQPINWVIAGGESGPRARPMHPEWARNLRDQCAAADVPFLFKQWGDWGPAPFIVRVCDPAVGWQGTDEDLAAAKKDSEARGATHVHTGNWHEEDGERLYENYRMDHKPWSLERKGLPDGMEPIRRWGKGRAGRELDGRTWDEFPEAVSAR